MKAWKLVAIALVLLVVLMVVAYAAQPERAPGRGGGRMGRGMMGAGRGMGRAPMIRGVGMAGQCPFPTMMGQRTMVAGADGIYVLIGDELLKYDHNLNLEREAELKLDWAKMAQRMADMHRNCPLCEQAMRPMMQPPAAPQPVP